MTVNEKEAKQDKLHRLVNVLPESELAAAERYLEYLAHSADPVALALELAPEDDEPLTDEDRAAIAEARAEFAAGHGIPSEQLKRELGL
jgi:hypothetical protein